MRRPAGLDSAGFLSARRLQRQAAAIEEVERDIAEEESKCRAAESQRRRRQLARHEQKELARRRRTRNIRLALVATFLLSAAGLAGFLALRYQQVNHGSGNESLLAYVPADCDIVLSVNAGSLAKLGFVSPIENALRGQVFLAGRSERTGLSPLELFDETLIAINSRAPTITLIARSQRPFNQRTIRSLAGNPRTRKVGDINYYAIDDRPFAWLFMPSDRTLMMTSGKEAQILRMIASAGEQISLPEAMMAQIKTVHFRPLWMVCSLRSGLSDVVCRPITELHPEPAAEYQRIRESLGRAECLRAWIEDLPGKLCFGVTAANSQDAEQLDAALKAVLRDKSKVLDYLLGPELMRSYLRDLEVHRDGAMVWTVSSTFGYEDHAQLVQNVVRLYKPLDLVPVDSLE